MEISNLTHSSELSSKNELHPNNPSAVTRKPTTNYNCIDIMKFLSAILVICIHTDPLRTYNVNLNFYLVQALSRIAVPFFFTASGYFFFKSVSVPTVENKNNFIILMNYIKRIALLYLLWSVIYFKFSLKDLAARYNPHFSGMTLYVKNFIFNGSYYHLWYLPALIFAVLASYFLLKFFTVRKVLIISGIFYIIGLLGDSYYGLIANKPFIGALFQRYFDFFDWTRNGLFFGLMFVALGAYLYNNPLKIKHSKIYLVISFGLLFLEVFTLKRFNIARDYNMLISLLPLTLFLFSTLINIRIKDSKIYKYLRASSVLIYCSHLLFANLLPVYLPYGKLSALYYSNSLVRFTLITCCSLVFSFLILSMEKVLKLKWLKFLH